MSSTQTPSKSSPQTQSQTVGTGKGKAPDRGSAATPPLLMPPAVTLTGATPDPSPIEPRTPPPVHDRGKGKRKADEEDGNTPPDLKRDKQQRATFSAHDPRPHRASANSASASSHAPSSYHRKRAKLSGSTFSSTAPGMSAVGEAGGGSRPGSRAESYSAGGATNAGNTGSAASRGSKSNWGQNLFRSQSRASQNQSERAPSRTGSHRHQQSTSSNYQGPPRSPSRRSMSQASIPISALISPHAPSISHRSAVFHMRDPRRPAPIQSTPWALTFPSPGDGQRGFMSKWTWRDVLDRLRGRGVDEKGLEQVGWVEGGGSPLHAWLFFIGFVLFPVWWVAGFVIPIPRTRRLGEPSGMEKGVVLDDPQVEHDARAWRKRCRIMAGVSLLTYLPFIILVAIFAPR